MKRNRIVQFLRNQRRKHGYKSQYRSLTPDKRENTSDKSLNKVLKIANVFIAAGTMVMAIANILVIYYTHKQLTIIKQQMASSDKKDSAFAHDIHLEDRAYVSAATMALNFIKSEVHGQKGLHDVGQVVITVENMGRTPAYNLQNATENFCVAHELVMISPDNPKFHEDINSCIPTTLYPLQSFQLPSFYVAFYGGKKDSLLSGKTHIYVFGNITYKDVFGVGHYTHFCSEYSFALGGFIPYSKYNTAN